MNKRSPHEVRIIGGQWKRSKLPVADRPGLRPTPDRVRETLFNWLGHDLSGWRCVDAFAGSGALGFEAASRGAAEVVLLESDRELARSLEAMCTRLGASTVSVRCTDAIGWLGRANADSLDLLFIDPPFDSDRLAPALRAGARLLRASGLIYVESRSALAELPEGWALHRQARAGAVHSHLLHRQ
ncbi:MAG: 16S rRNA (guanine(966)-N(2))-methyltransferase RsmD [Rubrivivax sp.]